ncbi:MAG: cupin domain-containing protein [Acidobacteria bacterium]|nr:cupin domain-containing protein [Acidobacteriota bacterium]
MRKLITGVDTDGRSRVVEEADLGGVKSEMTNTPIFATTEVPPPPRALGFVDTLDLGIAPGTTSWTVWHWSPNQEAVMHHTDTVDYDTILGGSIELILDSGVYPMVAGDCAVITGVDHSWRAGGEGCTMSVVLVGTPPPA